MIILAGQPRNGTSMMMRVLMMGGVPIEYSAELDNEKRKAHFGNTHGFFEIGKKPSGDKCFKAINLHPLKLFPDAKVIFIQRDFDQVKKSWEKINPNRVDRMPIVKKMREKFLEEVAKHPHIIIDFDEMQKDPRKECERIKEFVKDEVDFNVDEAVKAVDNNLYHNRRV